ncbi:hypothetical protein AB6A23_21290 [Paenibacillus tarimensis]
MEQRDFELRSKIPMLGVMDMSIIAGILACLFVYVIRQSLTESGEEDWSSY